MPDLYEIAKAFRAAIEAALKVGEIKEMRSFPCGCCSYASDLLQRYLVEQLRCLGKAVNDCACLCSLNGIDENPVLLSDAKGADTPFRS